MQQRSFPVIDPVATGENILRLRRERGLSVRDVQQWFNFEEPRAIYKWQSGRTLPTVDNLYALSALLDVPMNDILVGMTREPQEISCGSLVVMACHPYQKNSLPRTVSSFASRKLRSAAVRGLFRHSSM